MQWNNVSEFLAMGGYALYVWGSFGLTALVMVVEMAVLRKQRVELAQSFRDQKVSESTSS